MPYWLLVTCCDPEVTVGWKSYVESSSPFFRLPFERLVFKAELILKTSFFCMFWAVFM
jgi:hypothetical protein